ncbi:MAG: transcription elongation factor Spt5 [Desulfurococcaceae archaeon]
MSAQRKFYAVRTTAGRELDVALIIERRIREAIERGEATGVYAIIIPPGVKGYVFFEASSSDAVYRAISEVRYVKGGSVINVSNEELMHMIKLTPVIESLKIGDVVEIVRGPFRGMRAQIIEVDRGKNMVTVNILEAAFTVPITIPSDYVRPAKR